MPVQSTAAATITCVSPIDGTRLGSVPVTAPDDVNAAVAEAAEVQQLWAQLRHADRARYLSRAAQAIIDEWDELVRILVNEQGRPVAEAQTMELLPAVETLLWLAENGPHILGPERVPLARSLQPVKRARLTFEPLGVVAVLTPGAEPFSTPLGDSAIALMGGNGVVLHPSPLAALAGERIARAFMRAGLPEGLLQIVHGPPAGRPRRRRGLCARAQARDDRGRRQGRHARARRREHPARRRRRDLGGVRQRGPVGRLAGARLRNRGAFRPLPRGRRGARAGAARRTPG
jgi:acyl-CoA reductase-like NAD-dependent aldehyde dehydrogenase